MKKNIKVTLGIGLVGVAACFPFLSNGCASMTPESVGEAAPIIELATITGVKVALNNTEDGEKTVRILENAVVILDEILLSEDFDPVKVKGAIAKAFSISELEDGSEIQLAAELILDLYDIKYKKYAKNAVSKNEVSKIILTAIKDGVEKALRNTDQSSIGGPGKWMV